MEFEYLPEFHGAYLEDSYFLGIVAAGRNLKVKVLLALTKDHPDYSTPKSSEQHCYRDGSIIFWEPTEIEVNPKTGAVLEDSDGTLDFGSIELYRQGSASFRVVTEWFEAKLKATRVTLELV